MLVAPRENELLLLYIAATHQVVITVLVIERNEEGKVHGVQRPVYYLSEVLSPSKQRYLHYQKLAYGVFMTARKLRHYFSEHPIIVVNEAPLSSILNNPEATGRVTRWLLGNAHHDGLRVSGILQVSTRHRVPGKQRARFTQVRGPR